MPDQKKPKHLTFGQIAIAYNFVSADQVLDCVIVQKKMKELGVQPKRLGEIMVEKGFITQDQANNIFKIQGREGGHLQILGYKLVKKLGGGSMGSVYKAKQLSMDRMVAIKLLSPQLARNEKFVTRFMREARAVARLNHINIISGIDVGESNGINYFAMEYVDGPTLISVLESNGALDEKRSLKVTLQIARALEHAHKHNMVHRDIKPDNIMIAKDETAKLCDLGLARDVSQSPEASEQGQSLGTPNYISPEQAKGQGDIDIRSDIYSLGASMFHMVTGRPPYQGSAAVVMTKHISQPIPDPRGLNPEVSKPTVFLLQNMMAKDRSRRYQDPGQVAEDLERVIKGEKPKGPSEGGDSSVLVARIEGTDPPPRSGKPSKSSGPKVPKKRRRRGVRRRRPRRR
ncbi:MAG: serine/threonine protein kinase [Planctomycetota bacterium]|jgi:serine/threonine-protein kinase